jgi:hypothetical protein
VLVLGRTDDVYHPLEVQGFLCTFVRASRVSIQGLILPQPPLVTLSKASMSCSGSCGKDNLGQLTCTSVTYSDVLSFQ